MAQIESRDPVSGEKIRVTVTPERVEDVKAKTTVVSWVRKVDVTNIRGSICQYLHFFSSPETATKWLSKRQGTAFYSANDVYRSLKELYVNKYTDLIVQ
jgi:alkylmercury lyase